MIKVSVIIPTFGKPIFLEKAIKSVINQTLDSIELIIIDDNNPNTKARLLTEKIIHDFSKSSFDITYIKHEFNKNGAAARNTGLSVARGIYISFLDNDDEYHIERLEKCFNKLEKCSNNIAGVYSGCEFRKNGKKYHVHKKVESGNFLVATLACKFMFSTGSNIFVRRSVIDELKGFDNQFSRHQDYEFLVRLFKKYSLESIPEVLVIKNNENLNLPDIHKMINVKEQFLKKFKSIIDELIDKDQSYIYKNNYVYIGERALMTKQISIAKNYYAKAKEYGKLSFNNRYRKVVITILNYIK